MSIVGVKKGAPAPLPEIEGAYTAAAGISSALLVAAANCQLVEGGGDLVTTECLYNNIGVNGSLAWMVQQHAAAAVEAAARGVAGMLTHVPTLVRALPANPLTGPHQLIATTAGAQNAATPGGWFGAVDMTSLSQPQSFDQNPSERAVLY